MFQRRVAKTHGQLMRSELGESATHLWQAAAHAAGGAGAMVGPRLATTKIYLTPSYGRVRTVTSTGWQGTRSALAPLLNAAQSGSASAIARKGKQSGSASAIARKGKQHNHEHGSGRWLLAGLATAGAAAGAGAMVVRRRNRARWEEYQSSSPAAIREDADAVLESTRGGASPSRGRPASHKAAGWAGSGGEDITSAGSSGRAARPTEPGSNMQDTLRNAIPDSEKGGSRDSSRKNHGSGGYAPGKATPPA